MEGHTASSLPEDVLNLGGDDAFLVDNILKQCDGLETEVMGDKKAGKALEIVLKVCTEPQLRGFLHRVMLALGNKSETYVHLCCNPYGSHVLQTLFERIGVVLHLPEMGHNANVDCTGEDGVVRPPLSRLLSEWLGHMGDDLLGMSSNKSASHVLRALMLCVGGCQWVSGAASTQFQLLTGITPCVETGTVSLVSPLFDKIIASLLARLATEAGPMCRDASASATLQLAIVICHVRGLVERRDALVTAMVPTVEEAASLMQDRIGSRLMEVVIARGSDANFSKVVWAALESRARELALHDSGNFAVQKALQRAVTARIPLDSVLERIVKPSLAPLFQKTRTGVIVELMRVIAAMRGDQAAKWRKRIIPALSVGDVPRPLLVQLLGEVRLQGSGVARPTIDIACILHELGDEAAAVVDKFWNDMTEDEVLLVGTCRAWSQVVEAFLRGSSALACKRKFIRKVGTHVATLAKDKYGHHVVLTALAWLDETSREADNATIRKDLVIKIKAQRELIIKSQWGDKLLKKVSEQSSQKHAHDTPVPLTVESLLGDEKKPAEAAVVAAKNPKKKKKRERSPPAKVIEEPAAEPAQAAATAAAKKPKKQKKRERSPTTAAVAKVIEEPAAEPAQMDDKKKKKKRKQKKKAKQVPEQSQ